jgi:hypothetical protein
MVGFDLKMAAAAKIRFGSESAFKNLRRAFLVSVLVHLLGYGGWKLGERYQLFDGESQFMRWMEKALAALAPAKPKTAIPPLEKGPVELQFVETDPALAQDKPPEDAKYQGMVNQVAANPTATKPSDIPQIDGTQDKELRTTEAPMTAHEMTAGPAEPKAEDDTNEKARPQSKPAPGNLGRPVPPRLSLPLVSEDNDQGEAKKRRRVRHLKDVLVAQASPGERMFQEGGVGNIEFQSSLPVRSTVIGNYENAVVSAIKERWYMLLNERGPSQSGSVRLEFVIHSNGTISGLNYLKNEMGEFYGGVCRSAISDPAPYGEWPPEMKRELQSDEWKVTFTFWYIVR